MSVIPLHRKNCKPDERTNSTVSGENKTAVVHLKEVRLAEDQVNREEKRSIGPGGENTASENSDFNLVKKLFNGIINYARQGNFSKAEQIRESLIRKFPSAARAIVRADEIIDQEKSSAMDPEKIRPWSDLFDQFTTKESIAFYFALKEFTAKPSQAVYQQGSCDNRLYFIRSGQLKVKYFDYDVRKNVAVAVLRKGDLAGIEPFFTFTNHTTNLVAVEESTIMYLDKSAFQKIVLENSGIESKLFRYCEAKQIQAYQTRPETMSRRAYERYKAELAAALWRIDSNDCPVAGPLDGKIVDISSGGVGYRVKSMKIGEAACLHNSRILIAATYSKYGLSHELKKTGTVVSLKFHPMGECSVHIQFEEPMDEDRVIEIAQHVDVIAYI